MKTSLIISAAISSVLFATSAHASVRKSGVIESVDHANRTMVVVHKNGQTQEYSLADHTRVVVDGKVQDLSALAAAQKVTIAVPSKAPEYLRAKIVEVDRQSGVAIVKSLDSQESFSVRVTSATKVSGKASSVEELSEGQTIKLRYANNI